VTPAARRLLLPGLTTAIMVLILVGLGTWQVFRLQWKLGILAEIAAAERAAPVPLGAAPPRFAKVSVTGHFLYDKAADYGADVRDTSRGPAMGAQQIVPLVRPGAPPVLVDRGWIPESSAAPVDDPPGEVTVTGYVRPTELPHWFTPAPDLAARRFYTLDTAAIGLALGLPQPEPFVLIALGKILPETYPIPAQHLPRPPNDHLSYAITWYGLAVAAIVVFTVWARKKPAP